MNDNETSKKINLSAIRKVDSSISSIVESANQVALYKYLSESRKWEKTDIEGTLFVYMRSGDPQYSFIVLNRLSTTNLIEPLTQNIEFQEQAPFILYRNGKEDIYSIWFYDGKQCIKIYKLLSSLLPVVSKQSDKTNNLRQRSYSESNRKLQKQENAQMDIISLLTRAQDEYDKKSAAKDSSKPGKKSSRRSPNGEIIKPTPVRMNGETVTSSSTPLTLGMLFAQAGGIEKKPNEDPKDFDSRVRSYTANGSSSFTSNSGMNTEMILQNLLSNSAHTVHHIDGNQVLENSVKESNISTARPLSANDPVFSAESLEKDLKEKLHLIPKSDCEEKNSAVGTSETLTECAKSKPIDIPIFTPAMIESTLYSTVPSGTSASLAEISDTFYESYSPSFSLVTESKSFSPNQLLSPMDFTIPSRKKNLQSSLLSSSYSPEPTSSVVKNGFGSTKDDLLHPQSLINGPSLTRSLSLGKTSTVTPLNKDQFREALVYMLQSDDDFVIQLHECYMKSLKSQLNVNFS